jgi:hypothetical protein
VASAFASPSLPGNRRNGRGVRPADPLFYNTESVLIVAGVEWNQSDAHQSVPDSVLQINAPLLFVARGVM